MDLLPSTFTAIEHFHSIPYWVALISELLETIIYMGWIIPGSIIILLMGASSAFLWNVLGAIGLSLAWILPGYFFGQSLQLAELWLSRAGLLLGIIILFFIGIFILEILLVKKGRQMMRFFLSLSRSIRKAIKENPDVILLKEKYPNFFAFLKKRLNKNDFYGLQLTIFAVTFIYILLIFGGVVEDIINADLIVEADIRIANLAFFFRSQELIEFFLWITLLGKWQIITTFIITTILMLWIWGKKSYIVPFLVSVTGSWIFIFIGKFVFHRTRPDIAAYTENSFSFPSGHATIAMAFYGFIIYFLIRNTRPWKKKIHIFLAGLVLITMIGLSRLYLGVHYVSDVWGGYLIGALWLIIGIAFSEYQLSKRKKKFYELNKRKIQCISLFFIAIAGTIYITSGLYYNPEALPDLQPEKIIKIANIDAIFTDYHSKYTETLVAKKQEPLSLIIIAKNDEKLIQIFKKADWQLADPVNSSTMWKLAKAAIRKDSYPNAPMTPSFWNTKIHDFGFEKETKNSNVRERHHVRFWKTNYTTEKGDAIYVGTASFDDNIKWGITHSISPDIDTERDFLLNELQNTNLTEKIEEKTFVKPVLGKNFAGDAFFTDGNLYVIKLR